MARLLRSVLVLLFSALLLTLGTGASAHDELVGASPADGAELGAAPEEIRLTFSGEIATVGAQVAVTGGEGEALRGAPRVEGTEVVQELAELGPGDYEVTWRVTSQDGHPISGAFSFAVLGEVTDVDEPAETATEDETAAQETTTAPTATPEQTADATNSSGGETATTDGAGGMPVWAWVAMGVAVLGLLALLVQTWGRGRR